MSHGVQDPEGRLWLADVLWRLGSVQFGDFSLGRTVRHSPVYINPKLLISRPEALSRIAAIIDEELRTAMSMRNRHVEPFEIVAGVPIGGLHIATAVSLQTRRPLVYARPDPSGEPDEASRPHIEGIYRPGQTALLIDDLATGGGSLVGAVTQLRRAGLMVRDAVVLVDREQGAAHRLESVGVRLHPLLTLEVLLTYLHGAARIPSEDYRGAIDYLHRDFETRSEFD